MSDSRERIDLRLDPEVTGLLTSISIVLVELARLLAQQSKSAEDQKEIAARLRPIADRLDRLSKDPPT
jgi:hypothetical protein